MAAITEPFSSANTTFDIFDNSTSGQKTAMTTLRAAIAAAMQLALTDPVTADTNRASAFSAFESAHTAAGTFPSVSYPSAAKLGTITASTSAFTASDVDDAYTGTWSTVSPAQSGTWRSLTNSATVINAEFYLTTGVTTKPDMATATITVSTGSVTGTPTYTPAGAAVVTATSTVWVAGVNSGSSAKVGKITAIGDTGVEVATIEVKLLNESGTSKDTGSSNEGTTTIDFLDVPSDAGQLLMFAARNDRTKDKNRVFKLTHNSSGQVKWFVGIVSMIKTTEGAVDAMITNKATILIQDGLTIVNPA